MNNRINLSGSAEVDFNLSANEFINNIEENCSTSKIRGENDLDRNGKFKLGLDEKEFNMEFEIDNKKIDVQVYLQLSLDSEYVKIIETFSGVDFLVDVNKYYEKLVETLNKSAGDQVNLKLFFNGYSK